MTEKSIVLFDAAGRPLNPRKTARYFSTGGFQGARDTSLQNWNYLNQDIMNILKSDLRALRARSRDLARNDDSCRRYLHILKQNVLGHSAIKLQAKNRNDDGSLDEEWNGRIEEEWKRFCNRRRRRGRSESPSACGQMTLREIGWLILWNRAIDGEVFIQLLPGYPHNRSRYAVRFLNPDMLDASYSQKEKNGTRIEMGIEIDEFDRRVAYHFDADKTGSRSNKAKRISIPASQIIHIYRNEYIGQLRGIPDFAGIMKKAKMLNGVHEAVVFGWRVAASKMGFFVPNADYEGEPLKEDDIPTDVAPGMLDLLPGGLDFHEFNPDYPTSTYSEGYKTFMRQMANGLNLSSPTLSNDYSDVNYSSLRQALLEDREGWRCIQAEMIDDFYQPLFDEWYSWAVNVMKLIEAPPRRDADEPMVVWQPRGWPWVDPLKEVNAQIRAIDARLRTRQSIIAETTGADFLDTADELKEEKDALEARGLGTVADSASGDANANDGDENDE